MEQSYWYQQRQKQIAALTIDIEECKKKNITIEEPYYTECEKRYEIEIKMKLASKIDNKNFQRQLDSLKNRQLGPKWNTAWLNYNNNIKYRKECENIQNDIKELLMHKESIIPSIQYLCKLGYITDPTSLNLTLKGILATEVNEGHQILMTELYTQDILHTLTGEETVMILSCFQESDDNYIRELYVSDDVKNAFRKLKEIAKELEYIEGTIVYPVKDKYWNTSTELIEPMKKWMEGELASVICEEYGIFEGNFMRSIMKMANIVDEWISMATYCQHIEQVDKMMEVRKKIIREIPDSLYLHL